MMIGLFITPVVYPFDLVPENLQTLYAINPMVGVLEGFRWSMLGTEWPGALLLIPLASGIILLVSGAVYFERAQRSFADVI
jgi:lipopolysaccharide transport system permease protein